MTRSRNAMKIEVNLFATLVRYKPENTGRKPWVETCADKMTVNALLGVLNVPLKEVKVVFVNNVRADGDAVLRDGDRVGVFPPVGGG